jgi:hypothetical protein
MEQFNNDYLDSNLMVTEEVKEQRLKICVECNSFEPPLCKECQCVIGMMVAYTFKSCPLDKW